MKFQSPKKIVLTTVLLTLFLAGVFYAMRYVRSAEFQGALGMIFGQPQTRLWVWCPEDVTQIRWKNQMIQDKSQMDPFCRVEMEPLEQMSEVSFKPLAEAHAPNKIIVLESDSNLEVFRVEGLPFKSRKLTDFLKSL